MATAAGDCASAGGSTPVGVWGATVVRIGPVRDRLADRERRRGPGRRTLLAHIGT